MSFYCILKQLKCFGFSKKYIVTNLTLQHMGFYVPFSNKILLLEIILCPKVENLSPKNNDFTENIKKLL